MTRKEKIEAFKDSGYNITVTGRNVHVTDAMKDYALEKIGKLEKFGSRIIDVVITMDIQKLEHRIDIVMYVNHTKIKSSSATEDMYASIDLAVNKLEAQLRRYLSRLHDHHAKAAAVAEMRVNVVRALSEEEETGLINQEIDGELTRKAADALKPHQIIKQKTLPLKTLNNDEAIMKMELSQDSFMVFRGEADHKIYVIYRTDDGNYGIIHPEG